LFDVWTAYGEADILAAVDGQFDLVKSHASVDYDAADVQPILELVKR
jgi:hypothetical protein